MKKIMEMYNNSKFRTKLLTIFGVSALLPILIILIISARLNARNMTDKVNELMVTSLTQIAERVNLNLEVYTNLLYQMYQDEQITENIKILIEDEGTGYAAAYNQINNRLKQYNTTEAGVRCISVICGDGSAVVYDFDTGSSVDNLWRNYQDLRMTEPYKMAVDQPGMVIVPTMAFQDKNDMKHYFHIAKRVFDWENLESGSIATIVMTVDENVLNRICNSSNADEQETGINFIMSENGRVISYPDEDFSGIEKRPELSIDDFVELSGFMKNKNIAVNEYQDPVTGWLFYNAYDKDYMLMDVTNSLRLYVGIGAMALLAATVAILCLVRQINQSVARVVGGIKEVQAGNLDVNVPVNQHDEIGEIAENFNHMTVQVKNLIGEVCEATDKQKNAEIRALEAQINPHFLYNTLDSINWMAIEHGEYEISKMLRNLGVILRYSVNKSNSVVTVEVLEDWLEKYISLHQIRFDNVFTYQIHVEEAAKQKKIHKLLIQPFVENAILHGLKEKEGGGLLLVDISVAEDRSTLNIIIEDNGAGMSKERLEQYNDPQKAVADDGRSIGLHNAFSRMRMYYGEGARWHVNSIENMGTVVTIKLPMDEGTV